MAKSKFSKSEDPFEIPKTTRFLPLQEFDPENKALAGIGIFVWINPPRSMLEEFDNFTRAYNVALDELCIRSGLKPVKSNLQDRLFQWVSLKSKREADRRFKKATEIFRRSLHTWYSQLWSQGPDVETHLTAAQLKKLFDKNPLLFEFMYIHSWKLIEAHTRDARRIGEIARWQTIPHAVQRLN